MAQLCNISPGGILVVDFLCICICICRETAHVVQAECGGGGIGMRVERVVANTPAVADAGK